jgi:hypothetical protein
MAELAEKMEAVKAGTEGTAGSLRISPKSQSEAFCFVSAIVLLESLKRAPPRVLVRFKGAFLKQGRRWQPGQRDSLQFCSYLLLRIILQVA